MMTVSSDSVSISSVTATRTLMEEPFAGSVTAPAMAVHGRQALTSYSKVAL